MKITDHFIGIYRIYLNLIKKNQRMSTCNRLDLQTLGSQPFMPKNVPDHCSQSLELQLADPHTQPVHLQLSAGSPRAVVWTSFGVREVMF